MRNKVFKVALHTKYLGQMINTTKRVYKRIHNEANAKASKTTKKIRFTMLKKNQKTKLISTVVIPQIAHSMFSGIASVNKVGDLRASIVDTLWGKTRKMRAPEIVMAVHIDPTKVDPFFGPAMRFIGNFGRVLRNNVTIKNKLTNLLHLKNAATQRKQKGDKGFSKHLEEVLAYCHLTITPELQLEHPMLSNFPITEPKSVWLKNRFNDISSYAIVAHLSQRCLTDQEGNLLQPKNGRKDMKGIEKMVDKYATMALRRRKKPYGKHKDLMIEMNKDRDIILDSIISGSICPRDRLKHMGHSDTQECQCGAAKQTAKHLFHECKLPQYAEKKNIRRPSKMSMMTLNAEGRSPPWKPKHS